MKTLVFCVIAAQRAVSPGIFIWLPWSIALV